MQLDKRFRPANDEVSPQQRRRRNTLGSSGGKARAALLLALLLAAVVAIGLHIGPSDTPLDLRRRRLRQRQLRTPGSVGGDGSLFTSAGHQAQSPQAAVQTASDRGEDGEDEEAGDEAAGHLLPASRPHHSQQPQSEAGSHAERSLSFAVCNGFAHQRVALLSGEWRRLPRTENGQATCQRVQCRQSPPCFQFFVAAGTTCPPRRPSTACTPAPRCPPGVATALRPSCCCRPGACGRAQPELSATPAAEGWQPSRQRQESCRLRVRKKTLPAWGSVPGLIWGGTHRSIHGRVCKGTRFEHASTKLLLASVPPYFKPQGRV